jgi:hypothetical protein
MEITNKTMRPLSISLPNGKKLRLGPGKTGQITAKAASSPSVKRLVEAGKIAIGPAGCSGAGRSSGEGPGVGASRKRSPGTGMRQSGDR